MVVIKISNSKDVCSFVKRRKANLIKVFGGQCCICGFNAFQEALEFHHVNPDEKDFALSSSEMKNLEAQLEELKKCILVCSNCHKGIHAGDYDVPENWQELYNNEQADLLREELAQLLQKQLFFCKNCGKEISHGATFCTDCLHLSQRKVERPSREKLKELIRTAAFTQIASYFGVSDKAITKWCKSYGLPSRKKDIKKISDTDWLKI